MKGALQGRRATAAGAASGLGRSIAQRYAREGAHVALMDRDLVFLSDEASFVTGDIMNALPDGPHTSHD